MYDPNSPLATLDDLHKAYKVVQESSFCVRTPMMHQAQTWLQVESVKPCELSLKLENTQNTGSFKVRGLVNQLAHIPESIANKEIITISAGNYGKSFSIAMKERGMRARVLLPDTAPDVRERIIKSHGAKVERVPSSELQSTVDQYVSTEGMHYLHPNDDFNLICGHASVGFEILEEVPKPDVVVVCCGGGGLLSGVAASIKLSGLTDTRIYGVEPEQACCMYKSKQCGHAVVDRTVHSIASGLAPPFAGANSFRHVQAFVEDILLISEEEIVAAVAELYRAGLVVEPAGAAAFGALMFGKVPDIAGKRVVVLITGSNVSPEELQNIVKAP